MGDIEPWLESTIRYGDESLTDGWPDLSAPEYHEAVSRVLNSGVYTRGPEAVALEEMMEQRYGLPMSEPSVTPTAVSCSSGTTGLELAIDTMSDRRLSVPTNVIVPAATFHATGLAVRRCEHNVRLADVEPDHWTISPESVREVSDDRTVGVVAVAFDGCPITHAAELELLCEEQGWWLIEDACPALGSGPSLRSDAAVFSFNETKIGAAGEGGCVLFRSEEDGRTARMLRDFGEMSPWLKRRKANIIGGNLKMPELTAAVACVSMSRLDELVLRAIENTAALDKTLSSSKLMRPPSGDGYVPHKYRARLVRGTREQAESSLASLDVPCITQDIAPLHKHPAFPSDRRNRYPIAETLTRRTVIIGSRRETLWHTDPSTVRMWCQAIEGASW
jgi:perosamine synthetase